MQDTLYESTIKSLPLLARGKVRDIYGVGDEHLLIVTTDRLSAFDVVLPDPVPGPGEISPKSRLHKDQIVDLGILLGHRIQASAVVDTIGVADLGQHVVIGQAKLCVGIPADLLHRTVGHAKDGGVAHGRYVQRPGSGYRVD